MTDTQLDSFVEMALSQEAPMLHTDLFELSRPVKITDLMKEEGKDFFIHKELEKVCILFR